MNVNSVIFDCSIGRFELSESDGYLTHCTWTQKAVNEKNISPLLKKAKQQLQEYFNGKRKVFDLPLAPAGTIFQKKVWRALQKIPYGELRSYQQIAIAIKNSKACRAVGSANGKNPLSIIIPCHRVIRSNGELGGYTGSLHGKEMLLGLERKYNEIYL